MSSNRVKASLEKIGVKSLAVLVIVASFGAFYYFSHKRPIPPLSETAQAWSGNIKEDGPQKAYEDFTQAFASVSAGQQHSYAHHFGAALYDIVGPKGFPVCGNRFEYGCAHGFIVRALQVEGEGALGRLSDACRTQPYVNMCLHGIGHGLVSYLGYDPAAFESALAVCRKEVHDTSTSGCMGGATMEYGLKTMAFGALNVAVITASTTYEPCSTTSRDAKSACYFWLTGWWYASFTINEKLSAKEAIVKMGKLCENLPDLEYAAQCFSGLGDNVSMAAEYDSKKAITFCDAAAADPSERVHCKATAENILLGDKRTAESAPLLCNSETGELRTRCDFLARTGVAVFDSKQ